MKPTSILPPLHYRHFPATNSAANTQTLIVLHGLFGSVTNWQSLSKRFSGHKNVYALDLRNHGRSPHNEDMDLPSMAMDVNRFINTHKLQRSHLLGHSLGGKVAMQLVLDQPSLFHSLVVVDIAPKPYPPRHNEIFAAIATIDATTITHRNQADDLIQPLIPDQATRLFLLTNLIRNDKNEYIWRINTKAIKHNYEALSAAPETMDKQYTGPTLFIKGEHSAYIHKEDVDLINTIFPNNRLVTVEKAGHWVHAEQPGAFAQVVENFWDKTQ